MLARAAYEEVSFQGDVSTAMCMQHTGRVKDEHDNTRHLNDVDGMMLNPTQRLS